MTTRGFRRPAAARGALAIAPLALAAFASGCGMFGPPQARVEGVLTYQQQPGQEGATVVLVSGDGGSLASGTVKAGGAFTLAEGLPPGVYQAYVSPPAAPAMSPDEAMKASVAGGPKPPPEHPNIPAKYRQARTSGQSFDLKAGVNKIEFKME